MGRHLTNTEAHDIARSVVADFPSNIVLIQICRKSVVVRSNKGSAQVAIHRTGNIVCELNTSTLILHSVKMLW